MSALVGTIQLRQGTGSQWTTANPTLLSGEIGLETDTGCVKMGDGSTLWNAFSRYFSFGLIPDQPGRVPFIQSNGTLTHSYLYQDSSNGRIIVDEGITIVNDTTESGIGFNYGGNNLVLFAGSGIAPNITLYNDGTFKSVAMTVGGSGFQVAPDDVYIMSGNNTTFTAPNNIFSSLIASRVPYLDSSKALKSSGVTTTELSYIQGLTGPLQAQIDAIAFGLYWKPAVRFATIAGENINVSTGGLTQTLDGASRSLNDQDRILLMFQTNPVENGIWIAQAGGWVRAFDFDADSDHLAGATVAVQEGDENMDKQFVCSNDEGIVVGTDPIYFVLVGGTTYAGTTDRITVTGNIIDIGTDVVTLTDTQVLSNKFIDAPSILTALNLTYATQNKVAIIDSSYNLVSSSVSTTALGYIANLTSDAQAQIDTKLTITNIFTARQNLGMWSLYKTGSDQTTTSASAQDITGMSVTLQPGRYHVCGEIMIACDNTGGVKVGIDCPSDANVSLRVFGSTNGSSNYTFGNIATYSALSPSALCTAALNNRFALVFGEVEIVTAGIVKFQFASGTAGQTSTVYKTGSIIKIEQIS